MDRNKNAPGVRARMGRKKLESGAASQNRTDETTLEEWSFTTKLHPRASDLTKIT